MTKESYFFFLLTETPVMMSAKERKEIETINKDEDNDVLSYLLNIHKHSAHPSQLVDGKFYTYDTSQKFNSHLAI